MVRHATSAAGRVAPGESGESGDEPSLDIKREPVRRGETAGYAPMRAHACLVQRCESCEGCAVSSRGCLVRRRAAQCGAPPRVERCGWRASLKCGVGASRSPPTRP